MLNNKKILTVYAAPDGEKETPLYFGSVTVTETVTGVGGATLTKDTDYTVTVSEDQTNSMV